jgi:hypothetical protein
MNGNSNNTHMGELQLLEHDPETCEAFFRWPTNAERVCAEIMLKQ